MNSKSILENLKNRFRTFHVVRLLRGSESFDLSLSEEEVLKDLREHGNDLLLGRFSAEEVQHALTDYGVWKALHEKGYPAPGLIIRSRDPFRQTLKILTERNAPEDEDHLLCELRVFDAHLKGSCPLTGAPFELDALVIDWLNFQNPRGSFTPDRPQLPGQMYPGLGIMRICMTAIIDLAKQIGKEAVINIPEYYHNAVLYHPAFRFFSAYVEGRFLALMDFLRRFNLAEASHVITSEKVIYAKNGSAFIWKPHEQVLGLVPKISDYFKAEIYLHKTEEAQAASEFKIATDAH